MSNDSHFHNFLTMMEKSKGCLILTEENTQDDLQFSKFWITFWCFLRKEREGVRTRMAGTERKEFLPFLAEPYLIKLEFTHTI